LYRRKNREFEMKRISLKNMKKTRRIGLLVGVFFAATAILGGTAFATTAVLNGGTLTLTAPSVGDFAPVTLNGSAQSTPASMGTFTVTDARGTGDGWYVTVQAGQLSMTGHTLPVDSISMSIPAPGVAKMDNTSSTAPSITGGSYTIDHASAVTVASAMTSGAGMGSYIFTPGALTLSIPANAYAGTYTSTVTVSVVAGP
jgi:hypothetical protein